MRSLYFRQMSAVPDPNELRVSDPALTAVREKVLAGASLSYDDGVALYRSRDLHGVGRLANFVRERLHGDKTFYNRNRHINYTNVCALSCKFCSFYRKRGEEGAYEMPLEQVIATAVKARDAGATEVHIVGGLHPWLKFQYYLDMLAGIRAAAPDLHVKAFTGDRDRALQPRRADERARRAEPRCATRASARSPAAARRFLMTASTMRSSRARSARTAGSTSTAPRMRSASTQRHHALRPRRERRRARPPPHRSP
jgi:hypothetical protein